MSQYLTDFTFSVTMLIVLCTFVLLGVNITLYKRHMIKAAEIKYLLTCFILEWLVDAVLKLRKDVCHYTEFWENATIIVLVIIIYYKWRVSNAIHAVSSCAHFKTFYQSKSLWCWSQLQNQLLKTGIIIYIFSVSWHLSVG